MTSSQDKIASLDPAEVLEYVRQQTEGGQDLMITNAEAKLILERYDGLLAHIKSQFSAGCSQCEGLPCPGCSDTAQIIAKAEGR